MFFPGGLVELLRRGSELVLKRDVKPGSSRITGSRRPLAAAAIAEADSTEVLLRVEGVDKHFDALHAVNSANLIVPVAGIHGLIGPNGAGKTSLFNIMSGFLKADGGRIEFAGTSLLELQARDRIRLGITRTFQHVAVFGQLSCLDNVIIGRGHNSVVHSMKQKSSSISLAGQARTSRTVRRWSHSKRWVLRIRRIIPLLLCRSGISGVLRLRALSFLSRN